MPLSLGRQIRKARIEAGFARDEEMHQEELAQLVGVSRAQVSKWERDITAPDAHELKAIIRATDAVWLIEFFEVA